MGYAVKTGMAVIKRGQSSVSGLNVSLEGIRARLEIDTPKLQRLLTVALAPTPDVLPSDEITLESLNRQKAALDQKAAALTDAVNLIVETLMATQGA